VGAQGRALLDSVLSCSAIGAPDTVRAALKAFIARTGADELMITCQIFDHAQRLRSFEITSEIQREAAVTA
jgi:alkanesulfonate monooxygenase SsuD/methylene tetrahydromethanopterin reductase-like flavin-dependent oxidoreductase (luciferase family)